MRNKKRGKGIGTNKHLFDNLKDSQVINSLSAFDQMPIIKLLGWTIGILVVLWIIIKIGERIF